MMTRLASQPAGRVIANALAAGFGHGNADHPFVGASG
jgi:hypothetical protein